ncbi:TetR/AcrR family transcriptional regulator [Ktedonosporobacter rubrisoli]|uniref:TetR/AcrR family transcriptional regulator n=1 Tax=Ktedonosporobacter rubrisoli TaxID=2509675 RepID=A0A4V0YYF1_KTERU|nr:TetR/AcrR family transcriptional regulator [Ktedonosporobacter rubrisoli]QBD76001.1 TetR/AcrR family transcriptional regulator [Ktedonosporobacter rubrisoli]
MSQNSNDLRVRRTQKLLREALIALIEERHFDAITVGEIAERAMVSRAAFYRYYQDKYDLVEKIFEEMVLTVVRDIDPLRRTMINRFDTQSSVDPWGELFGPALEGQRAPEPWVKMFEHFAHYERLYCALLGKRGSSWFVTKMRAYLAESLSERLQALAYALGSQQIAESRVFADGFVPALIAAQLVDAITWWLEQGRPYTSGQIATYCLRLMCSTLREVSLWE